jgi:hypothetical protein
MERIAKILRRIEIVHYFVEHPDEFPTGSTFDLVFTNERLVLVRTASPSDNSLGVTTGFLVGGAAGAHLASAAIDAYRAFTQDRKIVPEVLDPLIVNGLALSCDVRQIKCEIQPETKSLWDLNMFSWLEGKSWVTFVGPFKFGNQMLNGSVSFGEESKARTLQKKIHDWLPIDAVLLPKISFEDMALAWETRILGPNARQERAKRTRLIESKEQDT